MLMSSAKSATTWLLVNVVLLVHPEFSIEVFTESLTTDSSSFWRQLVSQPPPRHSYAEKTMLPRALWDEHLFKEQPFWDWMEHHGLGKTAMLSGQQNGHASMEQVLPVALNASIQRCMLHVNHDYKWIMIRTRKAASTTITAALARACKSMRASGHKCRTSLVHTLKDLVPKDRPRTHAELARVWREYTVFTTARNPFARAASGYSYVTDGWDNRTGACTPPSLLDFCKQPMLLGAFVHRHRCRDIKGRDKQRYPFRTRVWDYIHTEPVSLCLATPHGVPVVDLLLRSEALHNDTRHLTVRINANNLPHQPPFVVRVDGWGNRGSATPGTQGETGTTPQAVELDSWRKRNLQQQQQQQLDARVKQQLALHGRGLKNTSAAANDAAAAEAAATAAAAVLEAQQQRYAALFEACGVQCVEACAHSFHTDVQLYGYPQGWPGGILGNITNKVDLAVGLQQ